MDEEIIIIVYAFRRCRQRACTIDCGFVAAYARFGCESSIVCKSEVCTAKSLDGPNLYFAYNISTWLAHMDIIIYVHTENGVTRATNCISLSLPQDAPEMTRSTMDNICLRVKRRMKAKPQLSFAAVVKDAMSSLTSFDAATP